MIISARLIRNMHNIKKSGLVIVLMVELTVLISGCALVPQLQVDMGLKNDGTGGTAGKVSTEVTNDSSLADNGEPALDISLDENRIIQDQSFYVELNDWGNVRFISYVPDNSVDFEDVSFYLMDAKNVIYSFPYYFENNNTEYYAGLFDGIAAVAFCDVNSDNLKDVIIIINYITGAGPQGMLPRPRARIYLADKKSFHLATELIDDITNNIQESDLSIAAICEYLKNK